MRSTHESHETCAAINADGSSGGCLPPAHEQVHPLVHGTLNVTRETVNCQVADSAVNIDLGRFRSVERFRQIVAEQSISHNRTALVTPRRGAQCFLDPGIRCPIRRGRVRVPPPDRASGAKRRRCRTSQSHPPVRSSTTADRSCSPPPVGGQNGTVPMSTLRHLRIVLGVVIAATLAMGAPAAALAAEIRSGDTVAVGAAETINDDVYAFGNNIVIDGTVNGDVIAAGSTVTINGHVTGDVMMAGNTLIVNAPVDGSVRAAGNLVNVTAPIAGDAVVAGSAISVNGPGKIGRDVLAASGALTLRGPVGRNVKAGAGTLTLASNVGGSVQAEVSDLVVASGAAVQGPISYMSGKEASIAPDAQFGGSVQRSAPPTRTPNPWVIGGIDVLALIRGFVGLAVFGLVFALVFPRATTATADVVQRRGLASFGLGFGLFVGIFVLALLVCIFGAMVGGWWIGLIVLAAYIVFAVLGLPGVCRVGRRDRRSVRQLALASGVEPAHWSGHRRLAHAHSVHRTVRRIRCGAHGHGCRGADGLVRLPRRACNVRSGGRCPCSDGGASPRMNDSTLK
jgi:cytoskeletal protein CcmA (bactofilin family)